MVKYLASGRVNKRHENALEKAAAKVADNCKFEDQRQQASRIGQAQDNETEVRIIIDKQKYSELYHYAGYGSYYTGRALERFRVKESVVLPGKGEEGLDRWKLMQYSEYALDYFSTIPEQSQEILNQYNQPIPALDKDKLHLPLQYPRTHQQHAQVYHIHEKQAYIRPDEIRKFIIPWLHKLPKPKACPTRTTSREPIEETEPAIKLPKSLEEMIHLYNAMLQLSIAKRFQEPLIQAIQKKFDESPLHKCCLDTLEITVARFHSRGMPIYDPVISHLVQNYRFRTKEDRSNPNPDGLKMHKGKDKRSEDQKYVDSSVKRQWLAYSTTNAGRQDFPDDTIVLPPQLEVLGHCILKFAADVPEDEWWEVQPAVGQPGYRKLRKQADEARLKKAKEKLAKLKHLVGVDDVEMQDASAEQTRSSAQSGERV